MGTGAQFLRCFYIVTYQVPLQGGKKLKYDEVKVKTLSQVLRDLQLWEAVPWGGAAIGIISLA